MRQISKIHFTPEGEISNYFNFLKKFEIRTERPTNKEPRVYLLYSKTFEIFFSPFLQKELNTRSRKRLPNKIHEFQ